MKLQAEIGGKAYALRLPGQDISIPLHFDGPQPNTYGVAKATGAAYRSGGWVGDTREGGSCNFETYTLTPHCNGTHTECIGHVARERIFLPLQLPEVLAPATLLSVVPVPAANTADSYDPGLNPEDHVIDRASLEAAMPSANPDFRQAIVVRTLPNDASKQQRDYMQQAPAFFTLEAMRYLVDMGMQHLLTDLPSVDRLFDEGKLNAHHIFWNIAPGSHDLDAASRMEATITEMIFVPDTLPDGLYLLNLQAAAFMADAAPSRPFLFPLQPF